MVGDKAPMPKPVDPGVRQRIRDAISQLIWDQVTPWVYMINDGVRVTTHDRRTLFFPDKDAPGARELFWSGDYIEPFLRELCHREIAATSEWAQARDAPKRHALLELRMELLEGFIRLYWTMAEVHRQTWWELPNGAVRRDTGGEVDRMMAFLDASIEAALKDGHAAGTTGQWKSAAG